MLQALTNKQTITALTETLEDAVTMGADQTELAEGIRKRLEEGRAWGETAARFLAAPGRPPISALEVRSRTAARHSSWLLQTSAAHWNWRPGSAAAAILAPADFYLRRQRSWQESWQLTDGCAGAGGRWQ